MTSQAVDLEMVRPKEYLKNGFFNAKNEIRDGISGIYSLALAYQLRKEGVTVDAMKSLLGEIERVADHGLREENKTAQLDATSSDAISKVVGSSMIENSPSLKALADAALPWLKDWPGVAGFVIHLERAMKQLALINAYPSI